VNATVDDTQVGQVSAGQQATITPSGATTPAYGTVASIGLIASESSNVASFPVVIDVTGDPSGLYAGATADVAIIVKELNNVVEVPTASIQYSTSGLASVTQVKNGKTVSTPVTVGSAGNGESQITSGVVAGDKVQERVVKISGLPSGARPGGLGGSSGFGGGAGGSRPGSCGGGGFSPGGSGGAGGLGG
jgi:macrolide-specific efflux system membrane fusion protein